MANDLGLPLEDSPYRLDDNPPIFILGCPRSGTTFLSDCVGGIKGVEEYVGILAPPRMMHLIGSMTEDGERFGNPNASAVKTLMQSIRDIFWQSFWRRRYYRGERLKNLYYRNNSLQEFLRPPSMDDAVFCYKEPFLCFAAEAFAEEFTNARFVHIIRDGRDNADSMVRRYPDALSDRVLQSPELTQNKISEVGPYDMVDGTIVPWWVPAADRDSFIHADPFVRYAIMWREMVLRARRLAPLGPDRYLEVKYEDFVSSPIEEAEKILAFLGNRMSPALRKRLEKARTGSISIAKQNQGEEKYRAATSAAEDLLRELGYAV
ncbi:sulfotransferase family protein [Neolewinella xylanilytica]|uniref:Sulfotransferase family protein n=1 Tax=Neolewinella xylanilytica TaxID=1514080 RepID=A0A2S6I4A8_9BACT|nr:sulfotransferase [Neolewinella xylanilytica]PPK85899.1 sulfotransferase family protein [Neolewinella xylanilytica]